VEWLGHIPEAWEAKRFKTVLSRNDGGVWGEDAITDGTVVLRSTDMTVNGQWRLNDPALRRLTARERGDGLLRSDDLVVTKSSGSKLHLGKTAIVTRELAERECCFSNFMQRLRAKSGYEPRFLRYGLNCTAGREQLLFLGSTTTGLANLTGRIIGDVLVAAPTSAEQRAIAEFLDRQTAKIDELIAKKQRLIELLEEKRAALITHAVTRGLNADAPPARHRHRMARPNSKTLGSSQN